MKSVFFLCAAIIFSILSGCDDIELRGVILDLVAPKPTEAQGSVNPGEYLALVHNLNDSNLTFTAQFVKGGTTYDYTEYRKAIAGYAKSFNAAGATSIAATPLPGGLVAIAYADADSSLNYGTFVIYNSTTGLVTAGPTVFEFAAVNSIAIATLSNGEFVIAYSDEGNLNHGTFVIYDADGDPTTAGPSVFKNTATASISVAGLDLDTGTDRFVVLYKDTEGTNNHAYVLYDIDGTLLVAEQSVSVNLNLSANVAALTDGNFLIAYSDDNNDRFGTYIICDSDGVATTGATPPVFRSKRCNNIQASVLTTGELLFVYKNDTDTQNEYLIYDVSTEAALTGSAVFGDANTSNVSSTALDAGKYVIAYSDVGNTNYGTFIVTRYSGGTLTAVSGETVFEWATTSYTSVADLSAVSAGQFLIAYSDGGDGNKGTAVVDDGREYFTIEKVSVKEARLHNNTSETLELILSINQ